MRKVILKFNSPKELWEFKMVAKINSAEINLKHFTLVFDCKDEDIHLATQKYHAQIHQKHELLTPQ